MAQPIVIVPGIGFCKVYSGESQKTAWPPAIDPDSFIKSLMVRIGKTALFRKDSGFSDMIAQTAEDILSAFAADDTGALCSKELFSAPAYAIASLGEDEKKAQMLRLPVQALCDAAGEENVFVFPYVFSEDPLVTAKVLSESIENICRQCGSEKVSLLAVGCGSTVVTAYLSQPQAMHRLADLVFCFSPLDGTLLVSDLLLDSFDYRKSGSFLCSVMNEQDAGMFLELNGMIPGLLETVFEKVFTRVRELFLNLPAAWALCPSDDYPDLAEELLADKPQLRSRTDAFHAMHTALPQTLRTLQESGVNLHILAGSALQFIPLSKSSDVVSDLLINTSSAALNPSIVETADPIRFAIDTQAACFPQNTHYFAGVSHMKALKNEDVQSMLTQLLTN